MKRLLINGKHWEDSNLKEIGKYACLLVNVSPAERNRDFPHQTEDTWISDDFKVVRISPLRISLDDHNDG